VTFSDHCPVAVEIEVPDEVILREASQPVVDIVTGTTFQ
jgi:hypothetical protein